MHIRDLPKIVSTIKNEGKIEYVVLRFENYKKFVQKCKLEGSIEEADYLNRYADVTAAISSGKVRNATEHYLSTGYAEQRVAAVSADRAPPTAPLEK